MFVVSEHMVHSNYLGTDCGAHFASGREGHRWSPSSEIHNFGASFFPICTDTLEYGGFVLFTIYGRVWA